MRDRLLQWTPLLPLLICACAPPAAPIAPHSVQAASIAGARPYGTLAMGGYHGCALGRNGLVYCWGNGGDGELGNGATTNSSTPVAVTGLANQVYVAAGNATSCAVGADGSIKCWGLNTEGQLGNGTTGGPIGPQPGFTWGYDTPQPVLWHFLKYTLPLSSIVEASVGALHSCARDSSGNIWCWGDNAYGQLGNGSTTNSVYATVASGITSAIGLATGSYHTCALLANHTVSCWGANSSGQLGNGTTTASTTPVAVPGLANVVQLTAMEAGTCALIGDGTARCWGANYYGQMGNGTTGTSQLTPTTVSASAIASLARSTSGLGMCATLASGGAVCWGYNGDGESGSGTTSTPQPTPIAVAATGGSQPRDLAVGAQHACARTADGNLWCWGLNGAGQLGNGTTTSSSVPVYNRIPQWISPLQRIAATWGTGQACAVTSALGEVECWGVAQRTPVFASGLSNVIGIAGNVGSFEALRGDGTVWCWGDGFECASSQDHLTTPTQIPGIAGAVAVGPSCAVLANGTLWCWGLNGFGELGNGTTSNNITLTPTQVGLTDVVAVTGAYNRCALRADGTVWCWGANLAQAAQPTPAQLSGISNVVAITGSYLSKCALRNDGTVWCWGQNGEGELGNGTTVDSSTPVQVTGISNAVAIAASSSFGNTPFSPTNPSVCAILVDGTVRCWGDNSAGQLGNGTTSFVGQSTPVMATGVSNVLQIAMGGGSTWALTASGTLWAWGLNQDGLLGAGTTAYLQLTPIQTPISP